MKKFVQFIKQLILRTFYLPLTFGGMDYYPPVTHNVKNNTNVILRRRFNLLSDKKRYAFWTSVAKKHPTLNFFYSSSPHEKFIKFYNNKSLKYFIELKEFYRSGTTVIKNFFDIDDHKIIQSYFKNKVHSQLTDVNSKASWVSNSAELNNLIHKKISYLEKIIFYKNITQQKYRLACWKKDTNSLSYKKDSTLFHQDRFIPSIKLIYFPSKVEIDPYEYCEGSHIIDNQFYNNSLLTMQGVDIVNNNYSFDSYKKKKFYVDENSLVITATHGLHRRSQSIENISGIRDFITVSYYNEVTRYDLFFWYILSLFKK